MYKNKREAKNLMSYNIKTVPELNANRMTHNFPVPTPQVMGSLPVVSTKISFIFL